MANIPIMLLNPTDKRLVAGRTKRTSKRNGTKKNYSKRGVKHMAKKKRHYKRKHSNPGTAVMRSVKQAPAKFKELAVDGGLITAGFVGLQIIETMLPANITVNEPLKLGVKVAVAVVSTMLLAKVTKVDTAVKVGSGMMVNVMVDAINTYNLTKFIPSFAPKSTTTGAGAMVTPNLSAMINNSGMGLGLGL